MCSDVGELSHCCAIYSVIGALFQLFVGMLLLYQPFYIGGIKNLQKAKDSAFGAMFMFIATFVLSIILLFRDSRIKKRQLVLARGHEYDQVPTLDAVEHYEINLQDLPVSVVSETPSASTLSRRRNASSSSLYKDEQVDEEELEASHPHVPEGQLLPTTHV